MISLEVLLFSEGNRKGSESGRKESAWGLGEGEAGKAAVEMSCMREKVNKKVKYKMNVLLYKIVGIIFKVI